MATAAQALLAAFSPFRQSHYQSWDPRPDIPKKKKTWTTKGAAGLHQAAQHINGRVGLGVSPLVDTNDGDKTDGAVYVARWGALDVDELHTRMTDADEVAEEIWASGLPLVPARTKSGDIHAYLFLATPIPAKRLRGILRGCAVALGYNPDKKGDVEIFPKNVRPGLKGYSPGMNLPYFGDALPGGTPRYAYSKTLTALSLRGFFEAVDARRSDPDDLPYEEWPEPAMPPPSSSWSGGSIPVASIPVASVISDIYCAGNGRSAHHDLALAIGGMCAKSEYPEAECVAAVTQACQAAGDADINDRVRAVQDSYVSVRQDKQRSIGRKAVSAVVGETLTEGLFASLQQWRKDAGLWKPKSPLKKPSLKSVINATVAVGPAATQKSPPTPAIESEPPGEPHEPVSQRVSDEREAGLPEPAPEPESQEQPLRPALDLLLDYLLGNMPGLAGPKLSWRENSRAYAATSGRMLGVGDLKEHYHPPVLKRLLLEAIDLESAAANDSAQLQQRAAISVYKMWIGPAFQTAMNRLPERAEAKDTSTLAEIASLKRALIKLLVQPIRYSKDHTEIPVNTTILQVARDCMARAWTPVGKYPAYVRRGPDVAIRFDLILSSNDSAWSYLDRQTVGVRLTELGLTEKAKQIRVGDKRAYVLLIKQSFLEEAFGADEHLGDDSVDEDESFEPGAESFEFGQNNSGDQAG